MSGRLWIGLVIGLLLGNAAAMGVLLAKAGDTSQRVLPDYYRRAVAWDETAAARRASAALGWSVEASLDGVGALVSLVDATGAPIRNAHVAVAVRPRSRADHVRSARLQEISAGHYQGALPLAQPGLQELELTAKRGADTFLYTTVIQP